MLTHGDTFELNGLTFRMEIIPDEGMGAPWKEHDGHGIVSEWRDKDRKAPGERILSEDHGSCRFYDVAATIKLAKRDGWGLIDEDVAKLAAKLGRDPKPGDIAAEAVERDFELVRGWANGEWDWVGVVVTLLDVDGNDAPESESLWGIESNGYAYHEEVARDLAAEISRRVGPAVMIEQKHTYVIRDTFNTVA